MPNLRNRIVELNEEGRLSRRADSRSARRAAKATLTSVATTIAVVLNASSTVAVEYSSGGVYGSIDTTVSHGILYRIENPDPELLANANGNDGNHNYPRGIVSNTSKFTTDFSLETDTNEFSAFARVTGFYDFENSKSDRARSPLSDPAKSIAGSDIQLLDLYGTWALDVGGVPADLRLGRFVLNWGESTYIQNSINVINPVDLSKLRLPGSELREGLLPVAMASVTMYPSDSLSVEGFVQLDWERINLDPVGTYFSTNDALGAGAETTYVSLPGMTVTDQGLNAQSKYGIESPVVRNAINQDLGAAGHALVDFPDADFMTLRRGADERPGSKGQYGLAVRLFAESLNDTEFGVYFVRYHNRLPIFSVKTGSRAALAAGLTAARTVGADGSATRTTLAAYGLADRITGISTVLAVDRYTENSRYFLEYPKDQSLFGLSFNTQLGSTGWALQGEMSYRPDAPLHRATRSVIKDGLFPITHSLTNPAYAATYEPYVVRGYIERSVSQVQATATRSFGRILGSDGMTFAAELGVLHIHDMPDPSETPIESPAAGNSQDHQDADANSFGYRLATQLNYNGAIGAVNLQPYAQYQHDFRGNSPTPIGPFVEGRKGLTLGAKANYLSRWEFDAGVSYLWGETNSSRDRDFFYSSIKYSF